MKPIIRSSFAGTALALGLVAAPLALSGAVLLAPSVAEAKSAPTIHDMKQTLADYGQFIAHEKYGEVWKPTVTPRGWHPYPACDWVYTKQFGWYFSDKTVWGAIVHHYGRWFHDATEGWLWVPGAEFSPGWVVWRTSDAWVGWAPTPPDAELTPAKMEESNDDKLWTFMDAKKFGSTCEPGATVVNYGDVWKSTTYVTDIRFVDGVSVFVLPPAIFGPIVDIDINVFAPWSPTFIGSWVWNWTSIFNDIDIDLTQCKQPKNPKDPKDPNGDRPKDVSQPEPNNPKPFRPSLKDNAPPPPPGGVNRRQRPQDIDTPQREWRQPKREARSFDPRADDVVSGGRRPKREIREFEPLPDDVVVEGRRPSRDPGRDVGERRPPVKFLPDGRLPQREAGGRDRDRDERQPDLGRKLNVERFISPNRLGGESRGAAPRTQVQAEQGFGRSFRGQ